MTPPEEDSTQSAHYVQVNGLNMYYVESGSGRPLILLHGGTVANSMWDPFVPLDYSHEDLQKIVEPTLIVLGDRDGIIPVQQAVDLCRMLPTAELAIIPNAVHRTKLNPIPLQLVLDFLLRQ